MPLITRLATSDDEPALRQIDVETFSPFTSPSAKVSPDFFRHVRPEQVLVAELDGRVVGYLGIMPATPLPSNAHVFTLVIAVSPSAQRRGIASRLMLDGEQLAVERGATRLTLRVLGVNRAAQALYARSGFAIEGTLSGEFMLAIGPSGQIQPVDDVLMGKSIPSPTAK